MGGLRGGNMRRSEVADLDIVLIAQEDVRGLDVAMDYAVLVGVIQGPAAFEHQHRDFANGQ